MTDTIAVPSCPRCSGAMWDNRLDKKNPKAPDFKCKDKGCVDDKGMITALWLKDLAKAAPRAAAPASTAKQAYTSGPHIAAIDGEHPALPHEILDAQFNVYDLCFNHAHALVGRTFGKDNANSGDLAPAIASIAATLYIQAAKGRAA